MSNFQDKIQSVISKLSDDLKAELNNSLKKKSFKKGEKLLEIGQVCKESYHVESGILSKFYYNNEKEITSEFYFEQDVALSLESYTSQTESIECIEALTDTVVIATDFYHFQKLKSNYPELLELDNLFSEHYRLRLEEKMMDLQVLNASQRYEKLLAKSPEIIQNIKLTHIATYLNVSLETLSRIRAKI